MTEVPDFIRRAIEAQGKTTVEEVEAALPSVDVDTISVPLATPEEEPMQQEMLDLGPDLCPDCKGARYKETRTGEFARCPTCNPLVTDGLAQGRALRDQGMARAERAAPEDWKGEAVTALNAIIDRGEKFTSDDVWVRVGYKPPEPRALGPYLARASKGGRIRRTGETRPSIFPEHHAYPCTVWQPTRRRTA